MRRVLFFTHAESGQANTILALALELETRPHVQVHVASFPSLSRRVHGFNKAINFHPVDGTDMVQTLPSWGLTEESMKHPPVSKSWDFYDRLLVPALVVWGGQGSLPCFFLDNRSPRPSHRVYAHIRQLQESDRRNTSGPGCSRRNLQSRSGRVLHAEPEVYAEQPKCAFGYNEGTSTVAQRLLVLPCVNHPP